MVQPDFSAIDGVLHLVDRPLWIVTSAAEGRRGGLVATWVAQVSLDPRQPMVMAALSSHHHTTGLILASRALALHLLVAEQMDQIWRFGLESGRTRDKFASVATVDSQTGSPVLADCLAWLECRVLTHYDGGDRLYFWADVVAGGQRRAGLPVTEQALLAVATDEQKQRLKANMLADIDLLSGPRNAWRAHLSSLAET